jgi:hypothetical protein
MISLHNNDTLLTLCGTFHWSGDAHLKHKIEYIVMFDYATHQP